MEIKILKYEPVEKGTVVGYVDISIGKKEFIIRRIAHLKKEANEWFNFPQFSMPGNEAKPAYVRYVEFNARKDNEHLFDDLRAALDVFRAIPKQQDDQQGDNDEFGEAQWQPGLF